jgi:hypothetical protein
MRTLMDLLLLLRNQLTALVLVLLVLLGFLSPVAAEEKERPELTHTPMVIPPDGEAGLHVEYDSGAHAVDLGSVERFVFISSDDPEKGDVRIRFTVIVQPRPVWRNGRWLDGRNAVFSQLTRHPLSRQSIGAIHDQDDT